MDGESGVALSQSDSDVVALAIGERLLGNSVIVQKPKQEERLRMYRIHA